MRLICPNCATQYEVDASAVPPEGRDVQCGTCNTTWFQKSAATLAEEEDGLPQAATVADATPEPPNPEAPETADDPASPPAEDTEPSPEPDPVATDASDPAPTDTGEAPTEMEEAAIRDWAIATAATALTEETAEDVDGVDGVDGVDDNLEAEVEVDAEVEIELEAEEAPAPAPPDTQAAPPSEDTGPTIAELAAELSVPVEFHTHTDPGGPEDPDGQGDDGGQAGLQTDEPDVGSVLEGDQTDPVKFDYKDPPALRSVEEVAPKPTEEAAAPEPAAEPSNDTQPVPESPAPATSDNHVPFTPPPTSTNFSPDPEGELARRLKERVARAAQERARAAQAEQEQAEIEGASPAAVAAAAAQNIEDLPSENAVALPRTPRPRSLDEIVPRPKLVAPATPEPRRSPFASGLLWVLILFALLVAVYLFDAQIKSLVPAVSPYLDTYSGAIDSLRQAIQSLAASVLGDGSAEP